MAIIQAEFDSKELKRTVSFRAVLPIEKFEGPYPTLYLLHGLGGNSARWLHYTNIRYLAESSGLAVIMPSGENAFYLDVPVKNGCYGDFGAYVGDELVKVTREMLPLSKEREDTFIAGMSMGGYGALRNGLKYHSTFGKIAVFAGAVHFYEYARDLVKTNGNIMGELEDFGDLDATEDTDRNPRFIINGLKKLNEQDGIDRFPEIYMTCGTSDALLGANESLYNALRDAGAQVQWHPVEGAHDAAFCDRQLPDVIKWLAPKAKKRG